MGIVKKLRDAAKQVDRIVEEEAPRPKPPPKNPPPKDARFVRGLGERIGFAGIVAFTVGAALFGAAGCRDGAPTQQPMATCDEPAVWCGGGKR